MVAKKVISTDTAPKAIGPYSQAVGAGNLLFLSGQVALDPKTGNMVGTDVKTQTRQCLENIKAILLATGASLESVVKTTVFLKSMDEFGEMNQIYQEYFASNAPARSTVEINRLPKDALVEIESVAIIG